MQYKKHLNHDGSQFAERLKTQDLTAGIFGGWGGFWAKKIKKKKKKDLGSQEPKKHLENLKIGKREPSAPSPPSNNKTLVTSVKDYAEADIKFSLPAGFLEARNSRITKSTYVT